MPNTHHAFHAYHAFHCRAAGPRPTTSLAAGPPRLRPHRPTRTTLVLLAATVLGMMALAGCGGSGDDGQAGVGLVGSAPRSTTPTEDGNARPCAAPARGEGPAGRLFSLADADLEATAVVDDRLGPRLAGATDSISLIDPASDRITDHAPVPTSVTGHAGTFEIDRRGSRAYVVETNQRGAGVETQADLLASPSDRLTVLDVCDGIRTLATVRTADSPTRVALHPDGRSLVVAAGHPARVVIHPLDDNGLPGDPVDVALPAEWMPEADPVPPGPEIHHASWSPDGRYLAMLIQSRRKLLLFQARGDRDRRELTFTAHVDLDQGPFGGVWSPDGRFFYVNHIGAMEQPIDELLTGPGRGLPPEQLLALARGTVQVVEIDEGATARVVQSVAAGVLPESMSISPDGRLVAAANIGATPVPTASPLYSPIASVTLWRRDEGNGLLTPLGETPFEGLLPEGTAFDPSSRFLAVASFHAGGRQRETGAVDIWEVHEGGQTPLRLHRRIDAPRGSHDLDWVD